MEDYDLMIRNLIAELTQGSIERFGEVKLSDFEGFSDEKKSEYKDAIAALVAGAILRSSLLRTCIRKWGIDEFVARTSASIRKTLSSIDDATEDYMREP
jgi:adenine-specific DNA methylase